MFSTCAIVAGYDRRQRYLRPLQSCPCQSSLVARSHLPNRYYKGYAENPVALAQG